MERFGGPPLRGLRCRRANSVAEAYATANPLSPYILPTACSRVVRGLIAATVVLLIDSCDECCVCGLQ